MTKRIWKRLLAVTMALCLMMSLLNLSAFAADGGEDSSAIPLEVGKTVDLTKEQGSTVYGEELDDPTPASWSSDNEAVATVSEAGVVTGVAAGTVTITREGCAYWVPGEDGSEGTYSFDEVADVAQCVKATTTWTVEVIGPVAQVGDTTYTSLDEAVEKAPEGSTIVLLADCTLNKGFNKTLTFTGNGKITIDKQLKTDGENWMCFGLYDPSRVLTFDGAGVSVEWTSDGTAPWLMLSLSGTLNVTNGASLTFQFDSRTTNARNAIYMNEGATINVSNGSTFQILGIGTEGTAGQSIQLDKTGTSFINVTGNSTFLIDGTNRGYVNSPNIKVADSTFTVQNCTSNASNGGTLTAVNSEVTYQNNAGHGLSVGSVSLENSSLLSHNNGLYGVYVSNSFLVDGTSTLTVTNNSYDGDCAGVNLTAGVTDGRVEKGAVVTISNNFCSGLSNRGVCTFEEGSVLTITNNINDKGSASYGGGVYNTKDTAKLVLPSDAKIYNNHAVTGGDDIYNTGTITFGPVGSNWVLDDCGHTIKGWYDDSAGARWVYPDHTEEFTAFADGPVTTPISLKAAHSTISGGGGGGGGTTYYTLTVRYLEEGTDQALVNAYTVSKAAYTYYDVTSYIDQAIEGYSISQVAGDPITGTMDGNKEILVYYIADEDVTDPETPLNPDPGDGDGTDIGDGEVPLNPDPDTDVPDTDVPKTGDTMGLWLALAALSAGGLAVLTLTERRKKA